MEVPRAWAYRQIERWHSFQIVVEDVRLGVNDDFQCAVLAQKVGRQDLDGRLGTTLADRPNGVGKMAGSTIGQIVAINRRNNDVRKAELSGRISDMSGLTRIQRSWQSGLYIAERARARACIAHDHERRVFLLPALANI